VWEISIRNGSYPNLYPYPEIKENKGSAPEFVKRIYEEGEFLKFSSHLNPWCFREEENGGDGPHGACGDQGSGGTVETYPTLHPARLLSSLFLQVNHQSE
jgi:hypothetical protein